MVKYFVLGASGGLGSVALNYLLKHAPSSEVVASSQRKEAAQSFEQRGINFQHADWNDLEGLKKAFRGVENLLFVSANTFDNELRTKWHQNVVDAAKASGVKHTYYTSLAWGGYSQDSIMDIQQAHNATEKIIKESGIPYTLIREGIYANSFPLFLNYYPSSQTVYLPDDGPIAIASREELAEASARLMIQGGHDGETLLLSGPRAVTLTDMVGAINEALGKSIEVKKIDSDKYVEFSVANDEAGKDAWFFQKRVSWYKGVAMGDGKTVTSLLEQTLGRKPTDGLEVVKQILKSDPEYKNHMASAK